MNVYPSSFRLPEWSGYGYTAGSLCHGPRSGRGKLGGCPQLTIGFRWMRCLGMSRTQSRIATARCTFCVAYLTFGCPMQALRGIVTLTLLLSVTTLLPLHAPLGLRCRLWLRRIRPKRWRVGVRSDHPSPNLPRHDQHRNVERCNADQGQCRKRARIDSAAGACALFIAAFHPPYPSGRATGRGEALNSVDR